MHFLPGLYLSVIEREPPSHPQTGRRRVQPVSLPWIMLITASREPQIPSKYQSVLETSRSVSMATWQGHDSVCSLPGQGKGPAGKTPASSGPRLPKDHALYLAMWQWDQPPRGSKRQTSKQWDTASLNRPSRIWGSQAAISMHTAANRCHDSVGLRTTFKNEVSFLYAYLTHNFIILLQS